MQARLSTLGLYEYDPTIFDGLSVPDGVNKQALLDLIISESAQLAARFPNTEIFKRMLATWSIRKNPIWARLFETTKLKYNPIENYDRYEDWTDNGTARSTSSDRHDGSSTTSGSATGKRAGFNESEMQIVDGTESGTKTTTVDQNGGATDSSTSAMHRGHLHGNIGVTSSQDMIRQEREVAEFDIYQVICDDFIDTFCIGMY